MMAVLGAAARKVIVCTGFGSTAQPAVSVFSNVQYMYCDWVVADERPETFCR